MNLVSAGIGAALVLVAAVVGNEWLLVVGTALALVGLLEWFGSKGSQ